MTSPVMRKACRAVTSAMVPLENRAMCSTPGYSKAAFSSCWWNGPPLVSTLLSQIFFPDRL